MESKLGHFKTDFCFCLVSFAFFSTALDDVWMIHDVSLQTESKRHCDIKIHQARSVLFSLHAHSWT